MIVKTFAITLRPRDGVTDDDITLFSAWMRKHCEYYYLITEKLVEDRHIHAALFLKTPSTQSNLCTTLLRLMKHLDPEEKAVFRKGIKVMYNADFLNSYMQKGDDTVVINECLPEAATLNSYYPPALPRKKGPSAVDPFYANLERLWWEHKRPIEETNPSNLRNFLMDMMNNKRVIRVVADNRKIFQISIALSRYINKETSYLVEPEPFHQDV